MENIIMVRRQNGRTLECECGDMLGVFTPRMTVGVIQCAYCGRKYGIHPLLNTGMTAEDIIHSIGNFNNVPSDFSIQRI